MYVIGTAQSIINMINTRLRVEPNKYTSQLCRVRGQLTYPLNKHILPRLAIGVRVPTTIPNMLSVIYERDTHVWFPTMYFINMI